MDHLQFLSFRRGAVHQLMHLNKECAKSFYTDAWPRWDYDLDAATLTFSEDNVPGVIASIEVIGSSSISGKTWLWAWANNSLPANVTQGASKVREFGEAENLTDLTQSTLPDDEFLGWEMTSIAAWVLGSKGGYRCPGDNGFLYVVYSSLRFVGPDHRPPRPRS
jgi:hypothetical protein